VGESNPWLWDKETKQDVYPPAVVDIGFKLRLTELSDWLRRQENRPRLIHHLERYFTADYTGRFFETFVAKSDAARFTFWDVFAVQALSVPVPPRSIHWLLDEECPANTLLRESRSELSQVQRETDWSLWTCESSLIQPDGIISRLHECLDDQSHIGPVTASKLVAAKLPNVSPIRDTQVATLMGLPTGEQWWVPMRKLFESDDYALVNYLASLPLPHETDGVTVLRRLDVVLWMEAKARFPKRPSSVKSRFGA